MLRGRQLASSIPGRISAFSGRADVFGRVPLERAREQVPDLFSRVATRFAAALALAVPRGRAGLCCPPRCRLYTYTLQPALRCMAAAESKSQPWFTGTARLMDVPLRAISLLDWTGAHMLDELRNLYRDYKISVRGYRLYYQCPERGYH